VKKAQALFDAWKANRKMLEELQGGLAGNLLMTLLSEFEKGATVKYTTEGLNVKALTEAATKSVETPGRLLILVNKAGDKANVIVASSGPHNAGEICKRLCAQLGGGGGGKPTLAMGGGNNKDVEGIIGEFKV
jgi:alanyl-tRNA synthetase